MNYVLRLRSPNRSCFGQPCSFDDCSWVLAWFTNSNLNLQACILGRESPFISFFYVALQFAMLIPICYAVISAPPRGLEDDADPACFWSLGWRLLLESIIKQSSFTFWFCTFLKLETVCIFLEILYHHALYLFAMSCWISSDIVLRACKLMIWPLVIVYKRKETGGSHCVVRWCVRRIKAS